MAKAKVDKYHVEGTITEYDLLQDLINKHHTDFKRTEFLILMKYGGWKTKGKTVLGKFKVLADDLRSTWDKDAILYLNGDVWKRMSDAQKRYVVDNALFSLDLKSNKSGIIEAADGRPLLKTLPPDIEAYVEVVKRHGTIFEDVKRLAVVIKNTDPGQLTIDDATEKVEEHKEPREGIRGTISPDGSVTVEDKNQMTIEEAVAAAGDDPMHGVEGSDDDLPM